MRILFLSLFSIGMAYVEAVVVVYIRRLISFQDLSTLPIGSIESLLRDHHLLFEEQTREAATILMLITVAVLSGRDIKERTASFLWCFGLWDIFYYIFLRIWTGWPRSPMDMDVLFLIPAPWVSPVIVPVTISLIMAGTALFIFRSSKV